MKMLKKIWRKRMLDKGDIIPSKKKPIYPNPKWEDHKPKTPFSVRCSGVV